MSAQSAESGEISRDLCPVDVCQAKLLNSGRFQPQRYIDAYTQQLSKRQRAGGRLGGAYGCADNTGDKWMPLPSARDCVQ